MHCPCLRVWTCTVHMRKVRLLLTFVTLTVTYIAAAGVSRTLSLTLQQTFLPPHHHNRFTALFQGPPGEPVPEEYFWTLWCKGRLTEADTPTIRLCATPSGLTSAHLHHLPIFFTGRMPFLPPNQQHQSTEGNQHFGLGRRRWSSLNDRVTCTVSIQLLFLTHSFEFGSAFVYYVLSSQCATVSHHSSDESLGSSCDYEA